MRERITETQESGDKQGYPIRKTCELKRGNQGFEAKDPIGIPQQGKSQAIGRAASETG